MPKVLKETTEGQGSKQMRYTKPAARNAWLKWAFSATLCFTLCNSAISEVAGKVGPLCILYFAPGTIVTSLVYYILKSCRQEGGCWVNQNIINDGVFSCSRFMAFIVYCFIYFLIQNLAMLTMYFATEAGINVGVVTVIWSVNPLLMALADRIIYKTQLKYYHYVGLLSIMICTIFIALLGAGKSPQAEIKAIELYEKKEKTPAWIPVLFGIVTPCMFTTNGMFTKKVLSPEVGFDASDISFSAYFIVNILVLCVAIPYWCQVHFDLYLFWIGGIGSIINTLGLVSIQNALKLGPAGPVSAIAATSCILLVIIEAAKHAKMISAGEFVGLLFGIYGALILVIPEKFECCFPCFAKNIQPAESENLIDNSTAINKDNEQELN